jgi:NADH-quinone oxidoreductase subunit N
MATDFIRGLLPDHLVLALMVALMVLDMLKLHARWARMAFGAAMVAGLAVLLQQIAAGYSAEIIAGELRVDNFALLAKFVVLACGLALAAAFPGQGGYKFWLLLASSLLGALVIMDSAGFASLFMGIELLSLPAFALMVQGRGDSLATEGAFKYLLLSSVATALLLFGISLAYGATGTLSIATFAQALGPGGGQAKAAALLVLCGLFLKAAVFPFHAWAPDAYASARIEVTAVMASVVKATVVLALVRIVTTVQLDGASVSIIMVLAMASIVFGNIAAQGQRHFKRLLAYSSVAHAGYMIFALADTTGSRTEDLLWYTAIYALTTVLACAAFAALCPGEDDDALQALDGKFATQPLASLALAFAVLSLAGLPPFPGFFAKLFVFKSVVASGHLVPAVIAFIGSFLGLAYYLGMVVRLFRTETAAAPVATAGTLAAERQT